MLTRRRRSGHNEDVREGASRGTRAPRPTAATAGAGQVSPAWVAPADAGGAISSRPAAPASARRTRRRAGRPSGGCTTWRGPPTRGRRRRRGPTPSCSDVPLPSRPPAATSLGLAAPALALALVLVSVLVLTAGLGPVEAEEVGGPNGVDQHDFQMPFPCGQVWGASTHDDHPAVDWSGVGPAAGSADFGLTVVAGLGGRVLLTGEQSGYGQRVVIDHGDGWTTVYAHLSAITVRPGQSVVTGSPLGAVGDTGTSGGPHLHWEQRYLGQRVPVLWAGGAPVVTTYGSPGPTYTSANCPPRTFGVSLVPAPGRPRQGPVLAKD